MCTPTPTTAMGCFFQFFLIALEHFCFLIKVSALLSEIITETILFSPWILLLFDDSSLTLTDREMIAWLAGLTDSVLVNSTLDQRI